MEADEIETIGRRVTGFVTVKSQLHRVAIASNAARLVAGFYGTPNSQRRVGATLPRASPGSPAGATRDQAGSVNVLYSGEMGEPCGTPNRCRLHWPWSCIPAFSVCLISFNILRPRSAW